MKRRMGIAVGASLICLSVGLAACGGSETTTVIKEAPASAPETIERTTTVQPPAAAKAPSQPSTPSQEPPNVVGLPLPAAKHLLKQAGYKTAAKNTDTTFGILVPANYTICRQGKPRGNLVVVLAQKYGC
jgi:hypothetical protein